MTASDDCICIPSISIDDHHQSRHNVFLTTCLPLVQRSQRAIVSSTSDGARQRARGPKESTPDELVSSGGQFETTWQMELCNHHSFPSPPHHSTPQHHTHILSTFDSYSHSHDYADLHINTPTPSPFNVLT